MNLFMTKIRGARVQVPVTIIFFFAERLRARHLILQHALGRCIFVRHAPLSVTLLCPSRSLFGRHALLSVTLFYACAKGWQGRDTRVRALDGRMAMAEVRESTPDQTPGPSRARWMEGGGTVRLHHQRQLGLFTARGICMRTLRIPSLRVLIFAFFAI